MVTNAGKARLIHQALSRRRVDALGRQSPGEETRSDCMLRRPGWVLAVMIQILWVPGCDVSVHDGIGPRVPIPNVTGLVERAGSPAGDLDVVLRVAENAWVVDSTDTDKDGSFEFAEVAAGGWEIKVSGDDPGDFDSVSREFHLTESGSKVELPVLDVYAYGATALEPPDAAELPRPDVFHPIPFNWTLPGRDVSWIRVQLYDQSGAGVWYSSKAVGEESLWNGLGNRGAYEGLLVPAGVYTWRVKIAFPDTLEARTDSRELTIL
ncbi:MAG: hypothetical protein KAY24_06295 [Candidatus Eisenbacteria sp.]|nr:hypothetical protein [Candidatus Eisenbacteria bacterium]